MKISEKYFIGPNEMYDGCENFFCGIQMLCQSCPAKVSSILKSKKVCDIINSDNHIVKRELRKRVKKRVEKFLDRTGGITRIVMER